jgi:hypothetical protein
VRSRLAGGVAALVLVPALLAGCGGDGDEEPGAEKQRYIEQSDAVCRKTFAEANGIGTGRDQQTAQRLADVWAPAAEELKALPVPRESLELAEQFTTDVENLSLTYVHAARSAELNDQADVDEAFRDVDLIKDRAAETADEYGYEVCSQIGQVNR